MTPTQSEAIKQRYRDALALKCDPEIYDALLTIRKRAKQLDIPESEMRTLYLEVLNEKTKLALENGLTTIFCIGETLEEREAGNVEAVIDRKSVV